MHQVTQGTTAPTTASPATDTIKLHAQAVNGLSAALRFLTSPNIEADRAAFTQALARSMRATTALQLMCATQGGAA